MTGEQVALTPQGWVGYIVLTDDLHLRLKPKVPIANLFRMLEYAYKLKIHLADGLADCASLEEFYERLAHILARRVLDRGRKGFYRTYVSESDRLPYVRGQLDTRRLITRPWDAHLHCPYEEHTGDIAENQILAWTLQRIARSGLCSRRVLPTVRTAYRSVQSFVTPVPFAPAGVRRPPLQPPQRRLRAAARALPLLPRAQRPAPRQRRPRHAAVPHRHEPAVRALRRRVAGGAPAQDAQSSRPQEHVEITASGDLEFIVDLVLYDAVEDRPLCVLDTKYKRPETPAAGDIEQVVAYAVSKHCQDAALIYPIHLQKPLDTCVGGQVNVRSLTFALDGDLDVAGRALVEELLVSEVSNSTVSPPRRD